MSISSLQAENCFSSRDSCNTACKISCIYSYSSDKYQYCCDGDLEDGVVAASVLVIVLAVVIPLVFVLVCGGIAIYCCVRYSKLRKQEQGVVVTTVPTGNGMHKVYMKGGSVAYVPSVPMQAQVVYAQPPAQPPMQQPVQPMPQQPMTQVTPPPPISSGPNVMPAPLPPNTQAM